MSRKSLTPNLRTLLLMAVKRAGSYDPNDALHHVEESMTATEYTTGRLFLTWVGGDIENRKFGHGNIQQRFKDWANS